MLDKELQTVIYFREKSRHMEEYHHGNDVGNAPCDFDHQGICGIFLTPQEGKELLQPPDKNFFDNEMGRRTDKECPEDNQTVIKEGIVSG